MSRFGFIATTVLTIVCASQAAVVYSFDDLAVGDLRNATDGSVVWTTLTTARGLIDVVADPSDASNHLLQAASTRTEKVISVPTVPGSSVFNLGAQEAQFAISYTGTLSDVSGFMVGLWMDGVDSKANGSRAGTITQELAVQFGVDATRGAWRIVGANGSNDVHSSSLGLASGLPASMAVTLTVDLLGNGGDGSATLTVLDLMTNTTYTPYTGLSLGLLANGGYSDPSKYTGWYLQNSQVDASPQRGTQLYPATLDGLTLRVIPEPASLSILLAGVLTRLMPRRRKG